jgi:hypothetical protein
MCDVFERLPLKSVRSVVFGRAEIPSPHRSAENYSLTFNCTINQLKGQESETFLCGMQMSNNT